MTAQSSSISPVHLEGKLLVDVDKTLEKLREACETGQVEFKAVGSEIGRAGIIIRKAEEEYGLKIESMKCTPE